MANEPEKNTTQAASQATSQDRPQNTSGSAPQNATTKTTNTPKTTSTPKKSGRRIFSGVQPSGTLHIGNYIGAIKQWVDFQDNISAEDTFLFSIVDLHAITVSFEPEALRHRSRDLAAWFIAAGLDPKKASIFLQSDNPDHPYLAWIFNCMTPMGWLERMTQYKDKSAKQGERTSVGLFTYPNLMAADILLYDPESIPVGEDQVQHVELARDIAKKFNNAYAEIFTVPEANIHKNVARVMSLQDPERKMSKSDDNQNGVIRLTDSPDTIRKKVQKAVTDSGSSITYGDDKPALTNLIALYSEFSGASMDTIVQEYEGKGYGDFKKDLAEIIVEVLDPIQKKHDEIMEDESYIDGILSEGLHTASKISSAKVALVRETLGLIR